VVACLNGDKGPRGVSLDYPLGIAWRVQIRRALLPPTPQRDRAVRQDAPGVDASRPTVQRLRLHRRAAQLAGYWPRIVRVSPRRAGASLATEPLVDGVPIVR
jgi:hypothetical protein